MPRRIIEVDGEPWEVAVSGRVTQYTKDEFGLVFSRGTGRAGSSGSRATRRSAPRAGRLSLGQLSDQELRELLPHSQPSWTAPEMGYRR